MKKLKKILLLSDPYPNIQYEIFCYVKAVMGLLLLMLGIFFIFSPLLRKEPVILGFAPVLGPWGKAVLSWEERVFGQNFASLSILVGLILIVLGLWVIWQIKLVRRLVKLFKT